MDYPTNTLLASALRMPVISGRFASWVGDLGDALCGAVLFEWLMAWRAASSEESSYVIIANTLELSGRPFLYKK